MDKGKWNFLMEIYTMDNIKMALRMEEEFISIIKLKQNMKENDFKINKLVWAYTFIKMVTNMLEVW